MCVCLVSVCRCVIFVGLISGKLIRMLSKSVLMKIFVLLSF